MKLPPGICSQVATEPELQKEFSLSTAHVQDGARLDIVMNSFGGEVSACLCWCSCVLIHCSFQCCQFLACLLRSMKTSRKELMNKGSERMSMHALFTPVVMSASGGSGHEATYFHKRLAFLLSCKWGDEHSIVTGWFWSSLSFPCYVQLFSVFTVFISQFDTMLRLFHQWI